MKLPWSNLATELDTNIILALLMNKTEFSIPSEIKNKDIIELIKNCTKVEKDDRFNSHQINDSLHCILYKLIKSAGNKLNNMLKDICPKKKYIILVKIKKNLKVYYNKLKNKYLQELKVKSAFSNKESLLKTREINKKYRLASITQHRKVESIEFNSDSLFIKLNDMISEVDAIKSSNSKFKNPSVNIASNYSSNSSITSKISFRSSNKSSSKKAR